MTTNKFLLVLYFAIAVVVLPLAIAAILAALACCMLFLFLAWVVGYPLQVTRNNKLIGRLRWFTYHPISK